jgi:ribonuclease HI
MAEESFIIYADGGSRGNPGPAALGYRIEDGEHRLLKEAAEYLGETTNNVAEYRAAIAALKKLKAMIGRKAASRASVEIRMDSELLVRQLNALYKIREPQLMPLFIELWNLKQDFASVTFRHIPREENREADRLVNEALDERERERAR